MRAKKSIRGGLVAKVLADKLTAGYWSEEEALAFARAIVRENALRVFKLDRILLFLPERSVGSTLVARRAGTKLALP